MMTINLEVENWLDQRVSMVEHTLIKYKVEQNNSYHRQTLNSLIMENKSMVKQYQRKE